MGSQRRRREEKDRGGGKAGEESGCASIWLLSACKLAPLGPKANG